MENNTNGNNSAFNATVPYERLSQLQAYIGLDEKDFEILETHKDFLASRNDDFSEYFFSNFHGITDTKIIIEHLEEQAQLKRVWAHWFKFIFTHRLDERLLAYLWRIGIRHVEVNLDQTYSNLGFSLARQFCQKIIAEGLPPEKAVPLNSSVGKLLDFCLLIETTAYIETASRCDIEIMRGIADRVRNPVTVIGGNINRLIRKTDKEEPVYDVYDTISYENTRIADLVNDVRIYVDLFLGSMNVEPVSLSEAVDDTLKRLEHEVEHTEIHPEVDIASSADTVIGDKRQIHEMLYRLIKNSIEAAAESSAPRVRISSSKAPRQHNDIKIEIMNNGPIPPDFDKMFSPFYSTKPQGTGFGLPIAVLAVRKNHGSMSVQPLTEGGLKLTILLPAKST